MILSFRSLLLSLVLATAFLGAVAAFPGRRQVGAAPGSGPPVGAAHTDGPVAKETYGWKPVAIGGGGFITGLSSDDAGKTFVARTDVYGAYLWDDSRDRWRQLVTATAMPAADRRQDGMNEGVYDIAVAPSDPGRLYMAIKGAVYRSADRGATWTRGDMGAPLAFDANSEFRFAGDFLAVDPRNPDLVLFGSPADGLWRSVDGGVRWARVPTLPPGRDLRPAAGVQSPGAILWFERGKGNEPTGRIWACSPGNGMFVSSDGGASFAPLPSRTQPAPRLLRRGGFAPDGSFFAVDAEGKRVWRYRDGGWADITATSRLSPRPYGAIAIDPANGAIYLFDEGGRVFRSTNGGDRWWPLLKRLRVGGGDPPWLHVADLNYIATATVMFDRKVPGRLWLASGIGPLHADVSSILPLVSWTTQVRGIEELVANDVVQPPGGSPLFGAWDFGVHAKHDLDRFSTTYGPRERVLIAVQQLAWTPADPRFIVTNASDTRTACCAEDGQSVLAGYSTDGGRTWARFATLPQPPGTRAGDPWRMAFGTIAVAAGDVDNIVWQPSFNRSPYYTRDRGRSWRRVVFAGETLPFTGSHRAYHLQRKTLAADRVAQATFYLAHSGDHPSNAGLKGLWRTTDGGGAWRKVFAGEIAPGSGEAAKLRAVPGHAGHLFFTSAVADTADTRLRRSSDGGASWTALDAIDHVDDIAFGKPAKGAAYPAIYVSGRVRGVYGIWRSVDDAATWASIATFPLGTLDQVTVIEADKDVFGRVYVGYKGSGWIYGEPAPCGSGRPDRAVSGACVHVH